MILKNLSKRFFHFGKTFQKLESRKVRFSYHFQNCNFSKAKFRQENQPFKSKENSENFQDKGKQFEKNYIKLRLHHNNSKPDTYFVHISINLKVTFPQQGAKETKITRIETTQESNEPSIVMILDKSEFPPEDNLANKEIERFWNNLIEEELSLEDVRILSKCEIVGGKTNKRKSLAFTVELNKRSNLTLENLFEKFDTFLKH